MIFARLDDLAEWKDAPAAVREAARLLSDAIGASAAAGRPLPEGRTKLGGCDLIISEPAVASAAELPYETHRRFVDLQVVLEGAEAHEIAAVPDCRSEKAYDAEADCELYASEAARSHLLVMRSGDAAVYFPADAHKPRIQAGGKGAKLRKAVVKIPAGDCGSR
ncbi:MAG: YhcH/YjgK/YiaL family protein [Spirochaetaceae bacterium]|nr:YhcH/YjgK/YiaL family protein [Spirochaetaceae bacterium]